MAIDRHCVRPGAIIVRARPFIYLPQVLRNSVRDAIDRALSCCISATFRLRRCETRGLCFEIFRAVGEVNGFTEITFDTSARLRVGGGVELVRVSGMLRAVETGILTINGRPLLRVMGGCPSENCADQRMSGRLSLVVTGSFEVSTPLLTIWNTRVTALAAIIALSKLPRPSLAADVLSDFVRPATGDVFRVAIGGARGRVVYDLGRYSLAAR